jgi:hypothetical protein
LIQFIQRKPLTALWIALAVQIVGRLIDLQWHLSHDEFEGVSQQFRAHTVVWIGVLMGLGVSTILVSQQGRRNLGYVAVMTGALLYIPVATWHFIEHANGNDPDTAHVLIALAEAIMILGALAATAIARRVPQTTASPPRGS